MIEFKNVSIQYVKDFFALYNFNIKIDSNTILIGDHYLGTSAINRILAKIDNNYSGEVLVDNVKIKNIKDSDFNVAYVPQTPTLFMFKNLRKNLLYPLKIRKNLKKDAKNIVNNTITKYNLKIFNQKPLKMSLSEKKIITLLRAVLRKPKYILLEHFFDNLEEKYFNLALKILDEAKNNSTIIASEVSYNENLFKGFHIINLHK